MTITSCFGMLDTIIAVCLKQEQCLQDARGKSAPPISEPTAYLLEARASTRLILCFVYGPAHKSCHKIGGVGSISGLFIR